MLKRVDIRKTRYCVYAIEYHIVWCTKYRKKVLTDSIKDDLISMLRLYCINNKLEMLECNTDLDHIHMLISANPMTVLPDIIKGMKGSTARELFKKHPKLKEKLYDGHLWSASYFIATKSENTETQIRNYIQSQGDDENDGT